MTDSTGEELSAYSSPPRHAPAPSAFPPLVIVNFAAGMAVEFALGRIQVMPTASNQRQSSELFRISLAFLESGMKEGTLHLSPSRVSLPSRLVP